MRIYVSCDMEGVAGIVDWQQVVPGPEFHLGCRLLQAEVNAAIDGVQASASGATFVVNDSHGGMRNLEPDEIHGEAHYIAGRHKPLYMMEGLDSSFSAAFFVGYHGSIDGAPSTLSHTYNPSAVAQVRLNGRPVGESGINGLVAKHFGVPVALISGDQHTVQQCDALFPGMEGVVVKQSTTRFAADNLHPLEARRLIAEAAGRAVQRLDQMRPPAFEEPAVLDVRFRNADLTQLATAVRGVTATGELEVSIEGDNLSVFRSFVAVLQITRDLAAER